MSERFSMYERIFYLSIFIGEINGCEFFAVRVLMLDNENWRTCDLLNDELFLCRFILRWVDCDRLSCIIEINQQNTQSNIFITNNKTHQKISFSTNLYHQITP